MDISLGERAKSSILVQVIVQNRLLREALVRLFQKRAGFSVIGRSQPATLGVNNFWASNCDVVLLDSLGPLLACESAEELRQDHPATKFVLFGMDDDPEHFLDAVRLGVSGYLLNDASSEDIIAAVKCVFQGEAVCSPKLCMELFQYVYRELNGRPRTQEMELSFKSGLTIRQRQLMALVAKGMTNKEIAANLSLSEFTVKNHIHRVMKYVDAESRHEAVDLMRAGGILPPS